MAICVISIQEASKRQGLLCLDQRREDAKLGEAVSKSDCAN